MTNVTGNNTSSSAMSNVYRKFFIQDSLQIQDGFKGLLIGYERQLMISQQPGSNS